MFVRSLVVLVWCAAASQDPARVSTQAVRETPDTHPQTLSIEARGDVRLYSGETHAAIHEPATTSAPHPVVVPVDARHDQRLAQGAAELHDWFNSGGNAGRYGLSAEAGPDAADELWSGGRPSIIAWQPVIEGNLAFMVRQVCFPPPHGGCAPADAPVVAMELDTGDELWAEDVPFEAGDWTTWIAGVHDHRVYAARSGNGASVFARIYALDVEDGQPLWISDDEVSAGPYDGVVFAPNGDLIIGSFADLWRISAADGSTLWHSARLCSVSSSCGAARHGQAVYVADAAPGGHVIKRFDLDSGNMMYQSPVMPGFTIQNTPMVGPDGTVYLSRTQNNPNTDFFYAFDDTGSALVEKWHVPAGWTTTSELAVGPDGSVYAMAPGNVLVRLNPTDGDIQDSAGTISNDGSPTARLAIDDLGRLFFSNGEFSLGRLFSFDADLTARWDVPVTNINIGGPALGCCGTLVVCGVSTDVRAYRSGPAEACSCPADLNGDGTVNASDLALLLGAWGPNIGHPADLNNDGAVGPADLALLLGSWGSCG